MSGEARSRHAERDPASREGFGEVSEWFKEKVSKTFVEATSPGVQIPPSPQRTKLRSGPKIRTLIY